MAGLAGVAFTVGGFLASLTAFLVAAITIVLLLVALAFFVGTAQEGVTARLRASVGAVKRAGAAVLLAAGAWFVLLAVFADFFADVFQV